MEEDLEISTWKGKRATLILCEDIRTAQDLKMFVVETEGWPEDKVHLYAHSNSKYLPSISKQLGRGEVIIDTNLAGRGTDIKVTDAVNASIGLLCLMTFVARNRRVELQVFGRTARGGKPGSVQCYSRIRNLRAEKESIRLQ